MIRAMRGAIAVSLAVGVLILAASASADPRFHGGRVFVRGPGCTSATYRPSSIIFACADAGIYVTNIRYRFYGGRTATGTAVLHENNCVPDCAEGRFSVAPVAIRLADVVRCNGTLFYSRAYTRYTGHPPSGERSSLVEDIEPYEAKCSSILG